MSGISNPTSILKGCRGGGGTVTIVPPNLRFIILVGCWFSVFFRGINHSLDVYVHIYMYVCRIPYSFGTLKIKSDDHDGQSLLQFDGFGRWLVKVIILSGK